MSLPRPARPNDAQRRAFPKQEEHSARDQAMDTDEEPRVGQAPSQTRWDALGGGVGLGLPPTLFGRARPLCGGYVAPASYIRDSAAPGHGGTDFSQSDLQAGPPVRPPPLAAYSRSASSMSSSSDDTRSHFLPALHSPSVDQTPIDPRLSSSIEYYLEQHRLNEQQRPASASSQSRAYRPPSSPGGLGRSSSLPDQSYLPPRYNSQPLAPPTRPPYPYYPDREHPNVLSTREWELGHQKLLVREEFSRLLRRPGPLPSDWSEQLRTMVERAGIALPRIAVGGTGSEAAQSSSSSVPPSSALRPNTLPFDYPSMPHLPHGPYEAPISFVYETGSEKDAAYQMQQQRTQGRMSKKRRGGSRED